MAVIIKGIDKIEQSAGTNSLEWAWQNDGPADGEVLIFGENGQLTNGQPVAGISATGGTETEIEDTNGQRWKVHTFATVGSHTFNVTSGSSEIEYLVVGGGGGGGSFGGGGGAGGVLQGAITATPQNYTITVGDGGRGNQKYSYTDSTPTGQHGDNSSAFGLTAIGGGGGGSRDDSSNGHLGNPGIDGGSGGGGSHSNSGTVPIGGDEEPGQGNPGGAGRNNTEGDHPDHGGGGGGGAGEPGGNAVGSIGGGAGGDGIQSSITGSSQYYGGGGGGVTYRGGTRAAGGLGGGGAGGQTAPDHNGQNGENGTGGGGGAGRVADNTTGNGGSGIVIIRYKL